MCGAHTTIRNGEKINGEKTNIRYTRNSIYREHTHFKCTILRRYIMLAYNNNSYNIYNTTTKRSWNRDGKTHISAVFIVLRWV